jgi:hypothetical protein
LQKAFPEMKGFSPRNLKYMRSFAEAYPAEQFVQQVVAQIPWGHNLRILVRLRCFVVIDLKVEAFKPEFSGKMSFYVSAVDDLLKHRDDMPTIGMILCKNKKQKIVEYALRDMNKPIGVSTYQLREALPEQLQGSLPTVEQLEAELEAVEIEIEEE